MLDALGLGFQVCVVEDACRGIEVAPGAVKLAFERMSKAGAKIITSSQVQTC